MNAWIGVILGGGFFALTFFGLRAFKRHATFEGATAQHQRQVAMAEMVSKEVRRKDKEIDGHVQKKIVRVRRLVKKRRSKKTSRAANSFIGRTSEWK